jgi:hypothetical protein
MLRTASFQAGSVRAAGLRLFSLQITHVVRSQDNHCKSDIAIIFHFFDDGSALISLLM